MLIKNALIYRNHTFVQGNIRIEDTKISDVTTDLDEKNCLEDTLDASGMFLLPGLIDIHLHGCAGVDFSDGTEQSLQTILDYELRNGITTICPTTMTLPSDRLIHIADYMRTLTSLEEQTIAGFRIEGPFLSHKYCGSQDKTNLSMPDVSLYEKIQQHSGGRLQIMDLAPELPGAMELIDQVKSKCRISLGHTDTDYETACLAFLAGASGVTHCYNAMRPFHHREPGLIGAAMDHATCGVELITDGVHLHPAVVRNAFHSFGADRIILISDSMMATGTTETCASLGGQKVLIEGKTARLEDGTIAASVTNLFECLKCCVLDMGISLNDAIQAAAENPASVLHMEDRRGKIENGYDADLLLVDQNLNLQAVIKQGKVINIK